MVRISVVTDPFGDLDDEFRRADRVPTLTNTEARYFSWNPFDLRLLGKCRHRIVFNFYWMFHPRRYFKERRTRT